MEFWGAEVKYGEPLKVSPGDDMMLHLSQANLGELKKVKRNESVCLFLKVGEKKLVLGTLITDKLPQQRLDLVFDKDLELSHNWKNGNEPETNFDESESEDDTPLNLANSEKPQPIAKEQKSAEAAKEKKADAGKQKVVIKNGSTDEDSMSEDDEEDDESESDDSDDQSDESKEETPKKAETSKKRPAESATKTPVPEKKAKVTPQKTDGKKTSAHIDTPYPSKPGGKTPTNQQTPKSGGGSHVCKSCNRTFGSEKGLESHVKAKHGDGK